MDERHSISDSTAVLRELVAKHEPRIRRFIINRSGPAVLKRTTTDDLYQQTIEVALSSASTFKYQDDARFVSWVYTIARRTIANMMRDRRRGPSGVSIRRAGSSGVGVSEEYLPFSGRTPSSMVAVGERKKVLSDAIKILPEDYRRALTLYKLQELPLGTVAEKMQRTKGATCQLIARAMNLLRHKLEAVDGLDVP